MAKLMDLPSEVHCAIVSQLMTHSVWQRMPWQTLVALFSTNEYWKIIVIEQAKRELVIRWRKLRNGKCGRCRHLHWQTCWLPTCRSLRNDIEDLEKGLAWAVGQHIMKNRGRRRVFIPESY